MRWLGLLAALVATCAVADTISGSVVAVIDGDTLVVEDAAQKRFKIRLASIDAPERNQPFWMESARSLAALCFRKPARVEWSERLGRRYVGSVKCGDVDVNAEQVKRGMAWSSPRATAPGTPLYELEAYARLRHVGLWADEDPVAPWQWRAQHP